MTAHIEGTTSAKFASIKDEFARNFTERGEVGASVCVSVNGERVVDLWGGMADRKNETPWERDTISVVFSCTKAATALCAHILVDRGLLKLHAPVSDYWPEFAKNGKETTTVQMMLNHESAVPAFRRSEERRVGKEGRSRW